MAAIRTGLIGGLVFWAGALLCGCSLPHWMHPREPCAFQPGASKEELIAFINANITGNENKSGLHSWWSNAAKLRLTGTGMPVPPLDASIAVEAPRNLRLQVFNPVMGSKEVDIGSNTEEFWIWSKDSSQVAMVKHEDVPMAMSQLSMPVPINPDWLMEVFGVIPLDPEEFQEIRPASSPGEMELVAVRQSPTGESVEWGIRIDTCRGRILEHTMRRPGGPVIARALLGRYVSSPGSAAIPTTIRLEWPQTGIGMTLSLAQTEVNPPALAGNRQIWTLPHINGAEVVDLGAMARSRLPGGGVVPAKGSAGPAAELTGSIPAGFAKPTPKSRWTDATPGRVQLESTLPSEVDASAQEDENPFAKYRRPDVQSRSERFDAEKQPLTDAPLWRQPTEGVASEQM